jgi:hypothetical protein
LIDVRVAPLAASVASSNAVEDAANVATDTSTPIARIVMRSCSA